MPHHLTRPGHAHRGRRSGTLVAVGAVLATGLVALPAAPASAAAPVWEAPVALTVTGGTGVGSAPVIATGPGATATVVWVQNNAGGGDLQAATRASTGAWTTQQISPYESHAPQVVTAPDGTTTVAWTGYDGTFANQLQARTRSAAGVWGPVVSVAGPTQPAYDVQLAVAPDGAAIAVWAQLDDSATHLLVQAARRTADSWSSPQTLTAPGTGGSGDAAPALAVDAHGTATVAWSEKTGTEVVVRAARATPGHDFGKPKNLGSTTADPLAVGAVDGTAVVAWARGDHTDLSYLAAAYRGGRWRPERVLDTTSLGTSPAPPIGVTLAGSGDRIRALWTRRNAATDEWRLVQSTYATSWGAREVLRSGAGDASVPTVATLPTGEAVATWRQTAGTTATVMVSRTGAIGDWESPTTLGDLAVDAYGPAVGLAPESTVAAWPAGTGLTTRGTRRAAPSVSVPTLARPVRVGTPVSCQAAIFGASYLSFTWRRGHRVVGHAQFYLPTVKDRKHRVRCTVTAANDLGSVTQRSPKRVVTRGQFAIKHGPALKGQPQVGAVLKLAKGVWSPQPTQWTYVWKRGGTVVGHAKRYTPTRADRGYQLTVRLTASKRAYVPAAMTFRTKTIH